MRKLLLGVAMAALLPSGIAEAKSCKTAETRKIVGAFFDQAFVKGDFRTAIETYLRDDYIQHNPLAPDGKAAVLSFFDSMPADAKPKVTLARIIADCDMAAVHYKTEMKGLPPMAVVDIFRVQDGRIAEHWDVIQPMPEKSANPHPMF